MACDGASQPPTDPVVRPDTSQAPIPVPESPVIPQPGSADATVSVDARVQYQTIEGFGSSMRIFSDPHVIHEQGAIENALQIGTADQDAILRRLYQEIGLTRVRPLHQSNLAQPTPGSIPRRDWVFADGHIEIVKRAQPRGLQDWWLSPLVFESWIDRSVLPYVDWTMDVIRYWRSQGVELRYYSIVNEPSNPGVQVSAEFLRQAVIELGARLRSEGFQTRLIIPDDINPRDGAIKARVVLSDPVARGYVGAIATHLYDYPLSAMADMAAVAKEYAVPLWMTEFRLTDARPIAWGGLVYSLLADYDVSAVDYLFGFFSQRDNVALVDIIHSGRQFVAASITPAGYATAQYARYVRPGAKRVAAVSSSAAVKVTAFTRDGKLVLVALNDGATPLKVRFSITGLTGLEKLSLVRTTLTEKLRSVGRFDITGDALIVELPAESISTLIQ